jgi:hypothetical protein
VSQAADAARAPNQIPGADGREAGSMCFDHRVRLLFRAIALAVLVAALPAGCGYSVRPPFDQKVRTVYVPVFRSQTFRREINYQLTELVMKEIERRTPYKVVGTPEGADTVLEGVIQSEMKNVIVESPYNLPRQLNAVITVSVTWTTNPPTEAERRRGPTVISEMVNFAPELGETTETAFYRASQNIATQIVDMMEMPWQRGIKGD